METNHSPFLKLDKLQSLLDALTKKGYAIIGPVVRDQTIVYDEVTSISDMPIGITDEQEAGHYRTLKNELSPSSAFHFTLGPTSIKQFFYPPKETLWKANRSDNGNIEFNSNHTDINHIAPKAFIGVRSCELTALAIQDKIFLGGEHIDPNYKSRRGEAFIVAVNCSKAGLTCFCSSMDTGPKALKGYDIVLTEVAKENSAPFYILQAGSDAGEALINGLSLQSASTKEEKKAQKVTEQTVAQMSRSIQTIGLKQLLSSSTDHPHWEDVASRCLSCANCTMVCPTCFCSTVEDITDLTAANTERVRKWDSCFNIDFSYIHGGSQRSSVKSRYRQWMTHKLSTWWDQFQTSGCVGCGRCITWCPVGIDITEEVRKISEPP